MTPDRAATLQQMLDATRPKALETLVVQLAYHLGAKTPDTTLALLNNYFAAVALCEENPSMHLEDWGVTSSQLPVLEFETPT